MESWISRTEPSSFLTSKEAVSPVERLRSTRPPPNGHKDTYTPTFQGDSPVRPSPARSSCSTSSEDSLPSCETPITSPETSSPKSPLDLVKTEEEILCAQPPPTPTPKSRVRRRSSRSSSAEIVSQSKVTRPKRRSKAGQASIFRSLFDEKSRREKGLLTLPTSAKPYYTLEDTSSAVQGDNHQASHEANENKDKDTECPSSQESDPSSMTEEQSPSIDMSRQEKESGNIETSQKDVTTSDASAEPHGSFPEDQLPAGPASQEEESDPQFLSQTAITDSTVSQEIPQQYPCFERMHQSQKSQHAIHKKISDMLRKHLDLSSSPGYVYAFRIKPEQIIQIKIGRAEDPDERIKNQMRTCKLGELLKSWYPKFPVPHHERVEKLIHAELYNLRYQFQCQVCKKKDKDEPKAHTEWFQLDFDRISMLTDRWNNWMSSEKPYDSNGSLKPFWRYRLENYKGSGIANPHKLQDTSETNWTFEDTTLYWDRYVKPSATEIWWFHFHRTVSFFWNPLLLCIKALRDPMILRAALTFIALVSVSSFTLPAKQFLYLGVVYWAHIFLSKLYEGSRAIYRKK
jgi:hypothetical protein